MAAEYNGTEAHGTLSFKAKREDHGDIVECQPDFDGEVLQEMTQRMILNITCMLYHNLVK